MHPPTLTTRHTSSHLLVCFLLAGRGTPRLRPPSIRIPVLLCLRARGVECIVHNQRVQLELEGPLTPPSARRRARATRREGRPPSCRRTRARWSASHPLTLRMQTLTQCARLPHPQTQHPVMRRGRNGIESGDQIFTTVLTTKKDHVVGNCALLHISKAQLPNRKWRGVLTQNAHVLPQPPTAPWLAQVSLLTAFLSCNR